MELSLVGINHHTSPIEIRERMAFDKDSIPENLQLLANNLYISEVAILSTCNRTEVYYLVRCGECVETTCICHSSIISLANQHIIKHLNKHSQLSDNSLASHLYQYNNTEMVKHMMSVASGLNSMVLGEPQILGQMKLGFEIAEQSGTIKSVLRKLFQQTFSAAKKVRSHTEIGTKPLSVSSTAVHLAKQFFSEFSNHKVLLIGAGETNQLIARYLKNHHCNDFLVVNRTPENALKLVDNDSDRVISFNELPNFLKDIDLIFSSTSNNQPIIDRKMVQQAMEHRKNSRMLIIDLAVPRDVNPDVDGLDNVYLYSIDDLASIINQSLTSRSEAVKQANEIIADHQQIFTNWLKQKGYSSLIQKLRNVGNTITDPIVQKALKKIRQGNNPEEIIKELSYQLNQAFLYSPTEALQKAIVENDTVSIERIKNIYNLRQDI